MATLFINLTQHPLSNEQRAWANEHCMAVVETDADTKSVLDFKELPTKEDLEKRADSIVSKLGTRHPDFHRTAMIGGAPFFMAVLERKLKAAGIQPVYAFSKRVSIETTNEHGEVTKTSVLKHEGWVRV